MKKYLLIITSALLLFSCNDFLDVVPKGNIIPKTVKDYELLMIGGDASPNVTDNSELLQYSSDDYIMGLNTGLGDIVNKFNINLALYSWSTYRYADPTVPCGAWNSAYKNIYTYNKVIAEIDNATTSLEYPDEDKQRIKSQAYFGRAYQYLFLVNTFSKHYKASTAQSDPGVPLVLVADVTQSLPSRGTVEGVYNKIIEDLQSSLPHLPKKSNIKVLPTLGAGYGLLARTFLYKGDYENSRKYAALALQENSTLVDYTSDDFTAETFSKVNQEQYHFHFINRPTYGYLSSELVNIYVNNDKQKDKRLTAANFYVKKSSDSEEYGYRYGIVDQEQYSTSSVSVPEMMVTLAESQARLGNSAEAVSELNKLRNFRIIGNTPLSVSDFQSPTSLVKFCLEERRREMVRTVTRLFDLKRENLEPEFAKTTVHLIDRTTTSFTAEPGSNKLVLPIPAQVLRFNPGMPQN